MDDPNGSTDEFVVARHSAEGIEVAVAAGRALLGAAMLAPCAAAVVIEVDPVVWPTNDLRAIALAIVQMQTDGFTIDPIAVAERLHRAGEPVGLDVLSELMNAVPSVSLAPHYAEILDRYRRDRTLVELGDQLSRAAYSGEDVAPIVARIVEVAG